MDINTFWLPLLVKMLSAATIVVIATTAAERLGPFWGAIIASLPVSAGPIYVLLALDHDAEFIAQGALASLVASIGTGLYMLCLAVLCPRLPTLASIGIGLSIWLALGMLARMPEWDLPAAAVANIGVNLLCMWLTRSLRNRPPPKPGIRRWYDIPLRALLVAALVAVVTTISATIGPSATGFAAVFPIVMTSLTLIMQSRAGGDAVATIMASSFLPMIGFSGCLIAVHVMTPLAGNTLGLLSGLAASLTWSLILIGWRLNRRA